MKWKISSIVLTSVIFSQTSFAKVAEYPGKFTPFTKQECTDPTGKALYEAIKKKQKEVSKCHKEGEGEVKGAEDVDEDNNANHESVTDETTKNLKNCTQGLSDIEANILKDCSKYSTNRKSMQEALMDTREKNKKIREVEQARVTASASANSARKVAGSTEEAEAGNRAHEREEQARIMADTNTALTQVVSSATTLKKQGERVDSSIMSAYRFFQWLKKLSVFG